MMERETVMVNHMVSNHVNDQGNCKPVVSIRVIFGKPNVMI